MQRTRWQILEILKRHGRASLEELATGVQLVPVTVRAHLSVLERDNLVKVEELRGRIGRPYFVYSLTPESQELFPRSYDVLAHRLLTAARDLHGEDGLGRLLEHYWSVWANEKAPRLVNKDLESRVVEVAAIRSEEGALAEWEKTPEGYLIHCYNCPTHRVSGAHRELCEAELGALRRLLGADVERIRTVTTGEVSCSFRVGPRASTEEPPALLA